MDGATTPNVGMAKRTRSATKPATLFTTVWGITKRFLITSPLTTFATFTTAMNVTHAQSHAGAATVGRIFARQHSCKLGIRGSAPSL